MEEAVQDSGRKDVMAEFRVMASSLSKEMGMVETQLKQWKETAHETLSLRDKAQSLKASLSTKTNEQKILVDKCGVQVIEIKSLRHWDVMELTEAIGIKDKETEAYISEIETIGQAYEDMQMQNPHLLQQVTERDDYNIKLVSESVKAKQAQSFVLSDKQALAKQLQQVNTSLESLKIRVSHGEEQMKALLTDAIKTTEEDRQLAVNVETVKWELADSEKELQWLKSAFASSEKEHVHIEKDIDDVQLELDNVRSSRKNLEEELRGMNSVVAEMISETGEAAIQKLQTEIKFCKNILQCSVCTDRPKEVVIVKCYHLFCNYCVQKNLEIRHRKCPACGTPFGQNDIRFVKI